MNRLLSAFDWKFWAGICVGVIGAVISYWGIKVTRRPGYPGQLLLVADDPISLLDDITGKLPDFVVSYKGHAVSRTLMLIKGFLVNTGSKDITTDMIKEPITLHVAKPYRWVEISTGSTADPAVHSEITQLPSAATISWSVLRCKEHIWFQALVECSSGSDQPENGNEKPKPRIEVTHRITDTDPVNVTELVPNLKSQLKYDRRRLWVSLFVFLCCSAGTALVYSGFRIPGELDSRIAALEDKALDEIRHSPTFAS